MKARAALVACLLVGLAACDSGDGDGFVRSHEVSPLAGTYVSTETEATIETVRPDAARVRVVATRTDALPDVSGLPLCNTTSAGTSPARFRIGFELRDHGYFELIDVQNPDTADACYVQETGEYAIRGDEITTDSSRVATLAPGPGTDQATLVVAQPPLADAPEDLGDTDPAFDALNGTWIWTTAPGNMLRISEHPDHLEHELVRQVGRANDAEVPFPTSCHLAYETDAYSVTTEPDEDGVPTATLSYTVPNVRLIADAANGAGCDAYVARQNTEAAAGRLRQSWTLTVDDEHLVLNGHETHTRVQ